MEEHQERISRVFSPSLFFHRVMPTYAAAAASSVLSSTPLSGMSRCRIIARFMRLEEIRYANMVHHSRSLKKAKNKHCIALLTEDYKRSVMRAL